jgi:hypothetical protein
MHRLAVAPDVLGEMYLRISELRRQLTNLGENV